MFKIAILLAVTIVACRGGALSRQISCGLIPKNLLSCIGEPHIVGRSHTTNCSLADNECDSTVCVFRNQGWLEDDATEGKFKLNKQKISDYFDKYAKDHAIWSTAVQALKTDCLGSDLQTQGSYLNCAAYDVLHCILKNFVWNTPASQWSNSAECSITKQVVEACPLCPNTCFAAAIPIGSCNACYLQPSRKS
ncbi:uncharacterized protein LOC131847427 [Achroia grisella]|uniref:uncharacterized protein LOC131847427 n=1 Tax=Achroia grisella TaxID=688607 RepID=UPI0027D2D799|nr:uncharacterized protein LOC131847427 [Achroia grisella]